MPLMTSWKSDIKILLLYVNFEIFYYFTKRVYLLNSVPSSFTSVKLVWQRPFVYSILSYLPLAIDLLSRVEYCLRRQKLHYTEFVAFLCLFVSFCQWEVSGMYMKNIKLRSLKFEVFVCVCVCFRNLV